MTFRAILSAVMCLVASATHADTLWNHNGSLMHFEENGPNLTIYYAQPREGMMREGVKPGDLFFEGVIVGGAVQGTARVFSSKCAVPMKFQITGRLSGQKSMVLEGMRPRFKNCAATNDMKNDRLEFEYISTFIPDTEVLESEDLMGIALEVKVKPNFDCNSASTKSEVAICGSEELALLDQELGRIYRTAEELGSSGAAQEIAVAEYRRTDACLGDLACILASKKSGINDLASFLRNNGVAVKTSFDESVLAKNINIQEHVATASVEEFCGEACDIAYWQTFGPNSVEVRVALANLTEVNAKSRTGLTALAVASSFGSSMQVAELLARGADPNVIDGLGNPPLFAAIESGSLDVVVQLVEAGASLWQENNFRLSPVGFSSFSRGKNPEIYSYLHAQYAAKVEALSRAASLGAETTDANDTRGKINNLGYLEIPVVSGTYGNASWNDGISAAKGNNGTVHPDVGKSFFSCHVLLQPSLHDKIHGLAVEAAKKLGVPSPMKNLCFIQKVGHWEMDQRLYVSIYSAPEMVELCMLGGTQSLVDKSAKNINRLCGNLTVVELNASGPNVAVFSSDIGHPEDYKNDYAARFDRMFLLTKELFLERDFHPEVQPLYQEMIIGSNLGANPDFYP